MLAIIVRTENGNVISTWASSSLTGASRRPIAAKLASRAIPMTMPGVTIGARKKDCSALRPGKSPRVMPRLVISPSGVLRAAAASPSQKLVISALTYRSCSRAWKYQRSENSTGGKVTTVPALNDTATITTSGASRNT